jgi:hypothetical protein
MFGTDQALLYFLTQPNTKLESARVSNHSDKYELTESRVYSASSSLLRRTFSTHLYLRLTVLISSSYLMSGRASRKEQELSMNALLSSLNRSKRRKTT